jgi:hypothetical protein
MFGDARQHFWTDLLTVMEGKNEIGPTAPT